MNRSQRPFWYASRPAVFNVLSGIWPDDRSQLAFWNVGEAWACIAAASGHRAFELRSSRPENPVSRTAGMRVSGRATLERMRLYPRRRREHPSRPAFHGRARRRSRAATPVMSPRDKPRDFAEGLWLSVSNFGTLLKVFAAPLSSLLLSARRTAGRRSGRYAPTSGKDENLQQSAEV